MNIDMPTLLMLGGANPNVALACMRQARTRGLKIWLTDTEENLEHAPDIVAEADQVSVLSYRDREACVAWSLEQAKTTRFIGVYGSREFSVEAVAAVAEALNLPGNPLQTVELVRNKQACREALRKSGFRQPEVGLCSNLDEAHAFISEHPAGPWIMKPPGATGSAGVSLVRSADELEQAVAYLDQSCKVLDQQLRRLGIAEESLAHAANMPFLVECFQPGEEYSAEGVFVYGQPHVLVVTSKVTLGPPHFVEVGHAMPAELASDALQAVKETVEAALTALGLRWGQFHVECWLDKGQVVLGEVHARTGGDQLHFMTQHTTGIELYGILFDQLLGRTIDIMRYQPYRGASIRFLTPSRGYITAIGGWEAVIADPNCLLAELKLKVGDYIGPIYSSSDRPGFIVASGVTTSEAIRNAECLAARVQIHVQKERMNIARV